MQTLRWVFNMSYGIAVFCSAVGRVHARADARHLFGSALGPCAGHDPGGTTIERLRSETKSEARIAAASVQCKGRQRPTRNPTAERRSTRLLARKCVSVQQVPAGVLCCVKLSYIYIYIYIYIYNMIYIYVCMYVCMYISSSPSTLRFEKKKVAMWSAHIKNQLRFEGHLEARDHR